MKSFFSNRLSPASLVSTGDCVVNSAGGLNLVIESARPDTKHIRNSMDRPHADGAGGLPSD
jgi:hypothetical protein